MILIIGATGTTGRVAVTKLLERGLPVRVLTRDPKKARALPGFETAELVAGDSLNPESLAAAFAGVTKVFVIPPSSPDFNRGEENVIAAAKKAGVSYLVKLSAMAADPSAPSMALSYHYQGEQRLRQSGLPFTILRPGSFMQNFLLNAPTIKAAAAVYHCTGDTKLAFVDTRDVAEVAVALLSANDHEAHLGKTYDLTGPEGLTNSQAAAKVGEATSRTVQAIDVPPAAYEQALIGMGVPALGAAEVVNIYGRGPYREGQGAKVSSAVADILGKPARSFDEFARDHSAYFLP